MLSGYYTFLIMQVLTASFLFFSNNPIYSILFLIKYNKFINTGIFDMLSWLFEYSQQIYLSVLDTEVLIFYICF